jgi:simple sugar transport system substrate-binding protein
MFSRSFGPVSRLIVLLVTALAASATQAGGRYVFIGHSPDSDSWWNTIKNAQKQAAEDFGVTVDFRNPPNGDVADQARLIEQAAAQNYDGVMSSISDFRVLEGAIKRVTDKRIPLITINSGTHEESEKLGAIMHVGQPEYSAGKAAGERAKAAGKKSFVCVNHFAASNASWDRCRGFADALGVDFKKSSIDSGVDPTTVESKVSAYLRQSPTTEAVLALGPDSAAPTLRAIEKAGLVGKIYFGSFDLSDEISRGIKMGAIDFAIDQQPYLQGYLPVAVFVLMKEMKTTDVSKVMEALKKDPRVQKRLTAYSLEPLYGARHIDSGPGFVTKATLAIVEKYAGQFR